MTEPTLTLKEHLENATAERGSLADYARRCGLKPQQLYALRSQQKARSLAAREANKPGPAFVKVTAPSRQLTSVQLPNGVSIQLTSEALVEVLPLLKQL